MSKESNNNKDSEQNSSSKKSCQFNEIEEKNCGEILNNNDAIGEQTKREENPFSFKHFLKRDTNDGSGNNTKENDQQRQKTTGARPKIRLNINNTGLDTKMNMKRSPKFSSFDSQASLAEVTSTHPSASDISMINMQPSSKNSIDINNHRPYFQRSISTYDLDLYNLYVDSNPNQKNSVQLNTSSFNNKNVSPEISSALPDFVQDHIAMEMFFSHGTGSPNISPLSVELDHLPDFAINENEVNSRVQCGGLAQNTNMPFDLMCNSSEINRDLGNRNPMSPLDLPNVPLDLPHIGANRMRSTNDIPLDLTARNDSFGHLEDSNRSVQLPNADTFQTLPDFLSDGHIHSSGRQSDNNLENTQDDGAFENVPRSYLVRLRLENTRLKHNLENTTQIVDQQTRRITELETTLERIRNNESIYSENLAQSMEKVEQNINRSNKKAAAAQSNVAELKKKVKQLTAQVEILRQENDVLKEEGAVGGVGLRTYSTYRLAQSQELSRDLMLAASNAENHLRQLLTGVENLRVMATQIESLDNIVAPTDPFSDSDDDFTGPAL